MRAMTLAVAAACTMLAAPAGAQTGEMPISAELRALLDELERGESLTPPAAGDERPGATTEREPNDGLGSASLVAIDGTLTGTIDPRGDSDWWRVRAPRRGELLLESRATPAAVALAVRLWNADGQAVTGWTSAPAPGGALSTFFDLPEGGEYALELRDARNAADSPDPYVIALSFTPVPELDEPNDSIGSASEMPINTAFLATILPRGDADFIAVEADDQGELQVRVAEVPENLTLRVRLWNADGQAISGWTSALAVGGPLDASFDLPAPGRYVIELRDGRADQRSPTPFEVVLAFKPTGDRGEPNDTIGSATALAFEEPFEATILPRGDVDWYLVEAPSQGAIEVALTGSPPELTLRFRVWNADAQAITGWYAPLAMGGDNLQVVDLPSPGRYFLEVRDAGNGRSPEPYLITVWLTPTADRHEPNDTFATATPLTLGEPYRASILPQGDVDWYAVELVEQGALTVALTNAPPELTLRFRLWNADVQAITGWHAPLAQGGDNVQVVDLARPGRYRIEVRDAGNGRSPEPYTIQVDLAATHDSFEPNDTIGQAKRLSLGETVTATILPKDDVDWYRVDIGMPGTLRASIEQSPPNLAINIRFWNADVQAITGWFSPTATGGPVSGEAEAKAPGSYYLEVRNRGSDASSVEPYSLRIDASAE